MKRTDFAVAHQYGKWCGRWSAKGRAHDGSHVMYRRLHCKCWGCPYCGPRKAGRCKHAIIRAAQELGLTRFVTLTLDPKKLNGAEPVAYLRDTFNKFRTYLRRRYGVAPKFIAILEFQKNGNPHLHLLIDRYIEQSWMSAAWSAVGGGPHVDIRRPDVHRISRYLSKYLTKELLLSNNCPKKTRRITVARGISLDAFMRKQRKQHRWELLKHPIGWLLDFKASVASGLEFDENERLIGFQISTADAKKLGPPTIGLS